MRWNKQQSANLSLWALDSRGLSWPLSCCLLLVACCWAFAQRPPAPHPPEQKQIAIYSPEATYTLPIVSRNGQDYIGLFEVLEPLGRVSAKPERNKWNITFENRTAQFTTGQITFRVQNTETRLTAPFVFENARGFVSLHDLTHVLQEFLPNHLIDFHEAARRLFLDQAEVTYAAELKSGTTGILILSFSAPVNPFIATEQGKLRMVFRHQALLPNAQAQKVDFNDRLISSLVYAENNGAAELTVNTTWPVLASFGPDRKTITVAPVSPPAWAVSQPHPVNPTSAVGPGPQTVVAAPAAAPPPMRSFIVIIDPAHGGDDRGGSLGGKLSEKDMDLALARRLHNELQARGLISRLLRDGDTTIPLDQRASLTNAAVPSLYISVHSAGSGSGVHLFTANLQPSLQTQVFLPWSTAQSPYVSTSQSVAGAIATELLKRDIPTLDLSASVGPVDMIAAPALVVEVAVPSGKSLSGLNSPQYQEAVCSAVADAVASMRGRLPHGESTP
jgi:N-acetylmuramoyl-L-alanine amidase